MLKIFVIQRIMRGHERATDPIKLWLSQGHEKNKFNYFLIRRKNSWNFNFRNALHEKRSI
jgi:hypothetical protein